MESFESYEKRLESINNTILNYDNKANALLTALGIVFGFSLFSLQEISQKTGILKIFTLIFFAIYLISFFISLLFLILIIYPRGRNKTEKEKKKECALYYKDIYLHKDSEDFKNFLKCSTNEEGVLEQIRICARIAHTKEQLLIYSVVSIIIFALSLVCFAFCCFM